MGKPKPNNVTKMDFADRRREVTKRKFVVGLQPSSTIKSTKVSPIAAYALTSPFKEPESRASSTTSSRELAESISSSPLASIREHQNEHVTPSPRHEQTVQDETQFLSSTPKPGKAATRRRPVFYKDKPYSRPNSSSKTTKLNLSRIPKEPSMPAKKVAKTRAKTVVQDGLETTPSSSRRTNSVSKTTSYLGLNLSTTRTQNSNKRTTARSKASSNESSGSQSKASSRVKPGSVTKVASNKKPPSIVSVPVNKRPSSVTKSPSKKSSTSKSPLTNRPSSVTKSPSKSKKQTQPVARVEKRKEDSILVQSQPSRRPKQTVTRKKVLSSSSRTDSSSNRSDTSQSVGRKQGRLLHTRRPQHTPVSMETGGSEGDTNEDEENMVPAEVQMLLWQEAGTKRRKGDFSEVDVVLNVFTELLETQLDLCDSQAERRALQILEKYLVKDITAMIDSCQTLKTLQTDTRKASQMLLQKQKTLMELQKKRLKLEERSAEQEKTTASTENTQTVNKFLGDLKQLIDKC